MVRSIIWLYALIILVLPVSSFAAGIWRVVPIRIDFDQQVRSGSVTLHNEGAVPVNLQMKAAKWSQDSQGQDVYEDTADLIFFPKVLTIPPGENRILRSGINLPATTQEKTYRLFIEELPTPQRSEGAAVSLSVRFGVPVFAAPLEPKMQGEVAKLTPAANGVEALIRNPGNIHFRIQAIALIGRDGEGREVFRVKRDGWYLLAHAERAYLLPYPQEGCGKAATIELLVNTDKGDFSSREKVSEGFCRISP